LTYANNASYVESYVSNDLKTIWWNFTDPLEDGEILEIIFYADAVQPSGCGGCINTAIVTAFECQTPFTVTDTAEVHVDPAIPNYPPGPPDVDGDTYGQPGQELSFYATANDPNDDDIYYIFDWDDGTQSEWFGPYNSGQQVEKTHIWDTPGIYEVIAKAKDEHDAEGDWSYYPVTVIIEADEPEEPILEVEINQGFQRGVTFIIRNVGEGDANNVPWSLTVSKRRIIGQGRVIFEDNGFVSVLAGESLEITGSPRGFGRIDVEVTVGDLERNQIEDGALGFILFRFLRLKK
jgi:hypothetical protein